MFSEIKGKIKIIAPQSLLLQQENVSLKMREIAFSHFRNGRRIPLGVHRAPLYKYPGSGAVVPARLTLYTNTSDVILSSTS